MWILAGMTFVGGLLIGIYAGYRIGYAMGDYDN